MIKNNPKCFKTYWRDDLSMNNLLHHMFIRVDNTFNHIMGDEFIGDKSPKANAEDRIMNNCDR